MKKRTIVLLISLLMFTLAACGKSNDGVKEEISLSAHSTESAEGSGAEASPGATNVAAQAGTLPSPPAGGSANASASNPAETPAPPSSVTSAAQPPYVVKTYNGEPQGEPLQTQVSYENGVEIIRYEGLSENADMIKMTAISENYFYVEESRFDSIIENRIMDRYGNIFCLEKKGESGLWDIRLNRSGLQDDSFILYTLQGNYDYTFYLYSKEGDLLDQLPGTYCSENTVDFNYNPVKWVIEGTPSGKPIEYGTFSVYDMCENVIIIRESFVGEEPSVRYDYYDMEDGFKLISSLRVNSISLEAPPTIKNGVCHVRDHRMQYFGMTVYDDSRIKFSPIDLAAAHSIDENFQPEVSNHRYMQTAYTMPPSDDGWLLGEGTYGFQAYNIKTGEMANITSWDDQPHGSYFCYWWENASTNYPYEFEKDGIMLLSVADHENPGSNLAALYNINTGARVNDQLYEIVNLPDYKERPMLYTQDPDHWYGYLNDNFESVVTYADATTFSNGYALVSNDKKTYSIINEKLEVVVPDAFEANIATNLGHGLFELGYSNPNNPYEYVSYKYVHIGPQ